MNANLKILGIPGSLRHASYNRAALLAAQTLLPEGVSLSVYDLDGLPQFTRNPVAQPVPKLAEFKRRIREADAILFAAPEHMYAMLPVLNNAIDCAASPRGDNAWFGKPVAVLGASSSMSVAALAQHYLRQRLLSTHMIPVDQEAVMICNAGKVFDGQGRLTDAKSQALIRQLLENLTRWAVQLRATTAAGAVC